MRPEPAAAILASDPGPILSAQVEAAPDARGIYQRPDQYVDRFRRQF
jgi:hypothetical protein